MKKNLFLAGLLILTVFVYGCTGGNAHNIQGNAVAGGGGNVGNNKGNLAPDFNIKTVDGENLQLSELAGDKPTVLYFFATWCPNCANDLAAASAVYPKYKDKVNFLAIDLDQRESESQIRSYKQRYNLPGAKFAAAKNDVLASYGVTYTTTKYFIGTDGTILNKGVGTVGQGTWDQIFQSLSQ
jgi:peroxiredoxin